MNNLGCDGYKLMSFRTACGQKERQQKKPADGKIKGNDKTQRKHQQGGDYP